MLEVRKRKEVAVGIDALALLKIQVEKEDIKLKNYMKHILPEKANSFELTDEYKIMMNDILDRHDKGELNYMSEAEFRKITARK